MNKEITIYELLGFIKEDKAPKKIQIKDRIFMWCDDDYCDERNGDWLIWGNNVFDYISEMLNAKVIILDEENDEFEDIEEINATTGENCKRYIEFESETGHHKYNIRIIDEYLINKINQLNRNQKKIIERLNKDE